MSAEQETSTGSVTITPDLAGFRELAADRRVITVAARVVADADTPVSLYHRLAASRRGTFLLESVEHGVSSRWSFIGVRAAATLTSDQGRLTWQGNVPVGLPGAEGGSEAYADDPLAALGESLRLLVHDSPQPDLPPFTSGFVGHLGYDIVRRLEKLPVDTVDDLQVPELSMMLVTELAAMDHHTGEVWLMANAINFDATDERVDEAYADARDRVQRMVSELTRPRTALARVADLDDEPREVRRQRTDEEYEQSVRDAIAEIEAGECFQIVPSQRFEVPDAPDAFEVYRRLRLLNPSPYLYLLRMGEFDIVGSSPEALVTVRGGNAITRPIAGTRPRGATPAEDVALEAELLADEKERAEHLMLVDLGRNDLGRVCRPGTVEVVEFMQVRRFSHVMHLAAAVTGELAQGRTALEATLACFPAGTLSGAPKVRAMEIIERLEPNRRGIYGGVVGWFDFNGDSDTAIAIRTALITRGTAYVQAGGGVVADSVPGLENTESKNKAAAVLRAIASAGALRALDADG
ncbi:anthranilate synthase component I [Enemella dayhoffiae]|uniref:Anthranilate synthase component 1 n=1 Tax=Enemella dayhoffiae TaxID=2016507 RepID=A0A255GU96_9ACTN|nr:anthranilate synthase component I [Enemella dayhoffiae]OYO19255.1 anthranilate synthase component I [Enemella dayhoffiae]